jgi:hypothetical protein
MEKSRVPRGLWVPFPLGRPFGEPEDAKFQQRVLEEALKLLERRDGPVVIVDFPDDAPSMRDTAGWAPQVVLPDRATSQPVTATEWMAALAAELVMVRPHWEAAQHRFGRTTVGNSRLAPEQWAPFAARFLGGVIPDSPVEGISSAVVLRYVADDMKALYAEAVQAIGPQPSSQQVNRWFWTKTVAGAFLCALRTAALASQHTGFNTAGSRFLVPGPWVAPE